MELLDFVLHVDRHLTDLVAWAGPWAVVALALVVFCETGLVVMPLLPGDSLLFAAGAFAATGAMNVWVLGVSMFAAAVAGDAVNYAVGRRLGRPAALRLVRPERLAQAEAFYAKHGPRAVVLARFAPILRTVAPFVAGMGAMDARRFTRYNVLGAALWVVPFVGAGYLFGNVPVVRENMVVLILGVIVVSLIPVLLEVVRARRAAPLATAPPHAA